MSKYNFDAVIFDLDGVITKTALVHSRAWKKMFDEFLRNYSNANKLEFVEFDHEKDYLPFVDGKPRYKGVESFLESRNIKLPFGDLQDDPQKLTICGLGNRKNMAFNEVLDREGVEVYSSTVSLVRQLRSEGIKVGVASSSKNCKVVLERAGIIDLFETRVDGLVSAEIGLKGKPEPDIFTTAADNLEVFYDRSVVVEDAVSGVQAGAKGNFGLVLGIARENNHKELKTNGADIVVSDIDEIGISGIQNWFNHGLDKDNWGISYLDYIPDKEKSRETLLAVGNGYVGTRGALEELKSGNFNYPGTYMAGLYNRLSSKVGDRDVENEDFVNCPNWIYTTFAIDGESWIDFNDVEVLSIERNLSFRSGILKKTAIVKDKTGNLSKLESERFFSMDDPHVGGHSYSITPVNYSGTIACKSEIDGSIINDGVARYRQLNQNHLKPLREGNNDGISYVEVQTTQSDIQIAVASKSAYIVNGSLVRPDIKRNISPGKSGVTIRVELLENQKFTIEKTISIYSSRSWDSDDPLQSATSTLLSAVPYKKLMENSDRAWKRIWDKIDIKLEGDRLAQKLLRMHLYHLMVSFSPHNRSIDASITARGLHGEAYRGHIFWDELFILPLFTMHFPEITRAALLYRYNRLDSARKYANQHGHSGAMFPWQSGSDGREETQVVHLNPITGKWGADFSSYQRHVSLAVAYNAWQYVNMTDDMQFLIEYGAEMFIDICRFWASMAVFNSDTRRYSIANVMGPDEFHEKYPQAQEGGLKDNSYTNIMVVWAIEKSFEILSLLSPSDRSKLETKLNLRDEELMKWKEISQHLTLVIENNIIAQYDGYFELKELDWEYFRNKYENIYRMDRLLKAEGKSADDYKVAKQADTLQTFYNLDEKTVSAILDKLGYPMQKNYLAANLRYYLSRTSHGSTLSKVVHAQLANMINDDELSWELYRNALTSDFDDVQGGTTGEGIHAGVMAGTTLIAMQSFAGVDLRGDCVRIQPCLPNKWRGMRFGFSFKENRYFLNLRSSSLELMVELKNERKVDVEVEGERVTLENNIPFVKKLKD